VALNNSTTKGSGFSVGRLFVKNSIQIRSSVTVGGTGTAGAANAMTMLTKSISGMVDTAATDCITVTVPNAQNTAFFEIDALGILGAGGAVGAGETSKLAKYQMVVTRTAGLAAVATFSSAIGGVQSKVAGADDITSVVVTASAMSGANSASQTFTIKVAVTKAAGSSALHKAIVAVRALNQNASGITFA
jgi:hypothetical protein